MGNSQATGTASRRPARPAGNGGAGRGLQERVAPAEGGDVEPQSLLAGLRYMIEEWTLEEDLREEGVFIFTGGMRHLDTMPSDVRLEIFKNLDAADLCRLGCTSKSVESWLRTQPAMWAQCLIPCQSASSSSTTPNWPQYLITLLRGHSLPRTKQEAYCFSLNRLGSLGIAAAPFAEAIAAYADVTKYGTQVAQAAVRALGKLGAAALPHVHRILTCATDKVYRDKMTFSIYLLARSQSLWSYADALIELLPHLTRSTQRLQEVVTHLEKGDRPDILLRVLAHAGEAALPYKLKTMKILSSYLNSLTPDTHDGNAHDADRRPGFFEMYIHRKYMKRILASLPRHFIHSAEVQEMMQRGLEARLEGMKAELREKTRSMKAELQVKMAGRMKTELEDTKQRMKAEVADRMEIMQVTKLDGKLKRMKAKLDAIMEPELPAMIKDLRVAVLEAAAAAATVAVVAGAAAAAGPPSARISMRQARVLTFLLIELNGFVRFSKSDWPLRALMLTVVKTWLSAHSVMRSFKGKGI